MISPLEDIQHHIQNGSPVWLFLDYDGTLSDFAPNPDVIEPKAEIVELVTCLSQQPSLRVTIISGRRLQHVKNLIPVSGILLAGTYGIEIQTPEGNEIHREDYQMIRPVLDWIKPKWEQLLEAKEGFYLEDKGWSLAIHARFAENNQAEQVLSAAKEITEEVANKERFRILGGNKFLEIGPKKANKGETIQFLLDRHPFPGALPVYLGDDDKDEEGFEVVLAAGGYAIQVADKERPSQASTRLKNPTAVLNWLKTLVQIEKY
jgi:trehalose 6-phosphate phosphatase